MKKEKDSWLDQFVATEYRNMVKYVRKSLNERYYNVTAEDIVQDVALNLFTKLDFDAKIENIAGYVYRSIRNRIVDVRRKRKYEIQLEKFIDTNKENSNDLLSNLMSYAADTHNELVDDEVFYEIFDQAFNKLPAKHKAIIIATEFESRSFDDISQEWNIPVGTLLSWKHRGIKKLKEYINTDDFYINNEEYN